MTTATRETPNLPGPCPGAERMVWPVQTHPAQSTGPESKRNSGDGGYFSLDFSFYRTVLPAAPRELSALWCAGGRLSLGRALGASDHGAVQCRGRAGTRVELARHGARIRVELEKRGYDCEAGGAVRIEAPRPAAGARHRHRRGEPA